ncbi:saccharopine dehydrogenase family protein [Hyalangium rubrum]|uniref:Saccharopine dehydrogenase NADP-binding domain-containing protein n=1 Tax=Hyalangium rubrum TaxID=3103134 RepID=A0ABU5GUM7_9BACT|nr:saccharopine dehydrogenase NADP-binding domain-containing protein [Hyalangium sp. s54d21]MDY7224885.1 saccharopine dehydrogenase NADP-binding domain-containing protein [Hyalangium sp. s54d21]
MVLVGGYGVVGSEVARLLRARHSALSLALAGRTPGRGEALAREVEAELLTVDLSSSAPLDFSARAVVALVNDPTDRLLRACVRAGIPYVDITRWTARMQQALALMAVEPPRAPVVLASGWMGGVVPLVGAALARELGGATSVETSILYDLADRAGEDSIEFMDRMGLPFEIVEEGRRRLVEPLTGARRPELAGRPRRVLRLDTPEQLTLPLVLGARTVSTRIGLTDESATIALQVLQGLGLFHLFRGERFQNLRRALLRGSGKGGKAVIRVEVSHGSESRDATLVDERGQAHLTAVGATLALERALGLDGAPPPVGVAFPEQVPAPERVLAALRSCGVEFEVRPEQNALVQAA